MFLCAMLVFVCFARFLCGKSFLSSYQDHANLCSNLWPSYQDHARFRNILFTTLVNCQIMFMKYKVKLIKQGFWDSFSEEPYKKKLNKIFSGNLEMVITYICSKVIKRC